MHEGFPEDNHFGVVFYLSLVLLAVVGTAVWSLLDRKRQQYDRLLFWFRVYLRYILAMIMFEYGVIKFIPVQMFYPGVVDLLTPLGEQTRFKILWNFMGRRWRLPNLFIDFFLADGCFPLGCPRSGHRTAAGGPPSDGSRGTKGTNEAKRGTKL